MIITRWSQLITASCHLFLFCICDHYSKDMMIIFLYEDQTENGNNKIIDWLRYVGSDKLFNNDCIGPNRDRWGLEWYWNRYKNTNWLAENGLWLPLVNNLGDMKWQIQLKNML